MRPSLFAFYGLRLASELPLTLAPICARQDGLGDVVLTVGEVAGPLTEPVWSSPFLSVAADGAVLIEVSAVGRFLVRGGVEIRVQPAPLAAPAEIEALLMGPVAGALLHQRGAFPLHASCVDVDGRAIAIAGSAGRGKSTLAAALVRRGATLLGDNISVIQTTAGHPPVALQGGTGLQLWPDSRALFDSLGPWRPVRPGHAKQCARLHAAALEPSRLAAIIRLVPDRGDVREGIRRLQGPAALAPIADVIYQPWLGRTLGRGPALFRSAMQLADVVPIYEIRRPASLDRIDDAADWAIGTVGGT